ncbi:efflux RND transporter periplasmic adaptor subunit [Methylobacillus gramineus]|uniref:efflux RND transporter periplasmic adaptor subunit n=1 Tax=Methylobacillus gramineus TaxID=755169 RepID=UPI001CFFCD86|nr:efflux RND transporter periplasmic adaptor subunit [Methylobacillus gramineus]MCB5183967.1 efflux RND transporter periplasmic adaptor subunit [Methylobacillus gramineus]
MNKKLLILLLSSLYSTTPLLAAEVAKPKAADEVVLAADSPQLANLKIEAVTQIPAPASSPFNGKIVFNENFTARISSPVVGRALRINAEIGDTVKSGQVLMTMDSPDLGSAIADARKAQAELQLKKQAYERSRMLLDGGVIPHKELEASKADLDEAAAESSRASARLNNLGASRNTNESYSVRAPLAGIIVDRQVNPGSEVRPDAATPIFIITDPLHLWASIDLPERDLGKVNPGQSVSVEVDAYPGEAFSGKILSIGAMIDPVTRRIPIRCSVDSKGGRLKPEMYARITPLSPGNRQVIRIPNSALITEGLYSYVFVETSPGHIKKRRVTLDVQGKDFATVKQGLSNNEKLVTSGAILLNSELAAGK